MLEFYDINSVKIVDINEVVKETGMEPDYFQKYFLSHSIVDKKESIITFHNTGRLYIFSIDNMLCINKTYRTKEANTKGYPPVKSKTYVLYNDNIDYKKLSEKINNVDWRKLNND